MTEVHKSLIVIFSLVMSWVPNPTAREIDHRTLKLLVGLIALTLGPLTSHFADPPEITSISESYYRVGWSQTIFIGFLFAIAAFLLAHNGLSRAEMLLSKVAAVAALGVALYPCGCRGHIEEIPYIHFASAAVLFLILAYFCYVFYKRARMKEHTEANRRAFVYVLCGFVIIASILAILFDRLSGGDLARAFSRWDFYWEQAALVAFGVSWLTASRILPVLTRSDERLSLRGTSDTR